MSTQISIKQLPQITEINNGNLLLVQQDDSTNTLDYKNFVIGLDNTTFGTTITQHSTDISVLSSTTIPTFSANMMTKFTALSANLGTNILKNATDNDSLSSDVTALSANLGANVIRNATRTTSLSSILFNGNAAPSNIGPTGAFTDATPLTGLAGLPITIAGTNYNILLSATG